MKSPVVGRPRVGKSISITLTDDELAFVEAQIPPGGTRCQAIRAIIEDAMRQASRTANRAG